MMAGMATYVAFLRAINLGATRKFPKDEIRAAVEGTGATDVATYINTGNVRLTSRLRSRERVEEVLEEAFLADRGFEVPTIAYPVAELADIAADAAKVAADRTLARHYVYLLKDELGDDALEAVAGRVRDGHDVVVRGRAAHVLLGSVEPGQVDPLGVAKHFGVATNRTATVVTTLSQQWC